MEIHQQQQRPLQGARITFMAFPTIFASHIISTIGI
jgi:hypothetical protein